MRIPAASSVSKSNLTIDDISGSPNLVGYWKGYDMSGLTVPDHSGNGFDLTMTNKEGIAGDTSSWIDTNPGWLSLTEGDTPLLTNLNGSKLDTGTNWVVICGELWMDNVFSDGDMGQAWEVALPNEGGANTDYLGFNLSIGAQVFAFRVSIDKAVWDDGGATPTSRVTVGENNGDDGPHAVAGVFRPGTSISASVDGNALVTTALNAAVTGLEMSTEQGGSFGFGNGYNATTWSAVRNYQVWSFTSEPPVLDETLKWMSTNPDKIPGWWL